MGLKVILARKKQGSRSHDAPHSGRGSTLKPREFHGLAVDKLVRRGDNLFVTEIANSVHDPKATAIRISQILTAPNQLTLARLAFLPFIVIKLLDHHYQGALILTLIAGLSDGLDGLLARMLHRS